MQILLASETCAPDYYKRLDKERTARLLPTQQNYFDNLIRGLTLNPSVNLELITAPPVSASTHAKRVWQEEVSSVDNVRYRYLSFVNTQIRRFLSVAKSSRKASKEWLDRYRDVTDKVIICDPLNAHLTIPVLRNAKRAGCKIIAVITDLPQLVTEIYKGKNPVRNVIQSIYDRWSLRAIKSYDGYVLLSEEMNELVNTAKKPYVVIEGFCSDIFKNLSLKKDESKQSNRIVMYAGGIHEKFGVLKLAEAFTDSNLTDVELHIFGSGSHVEDIEEQKAKNTQIKYGGVLPWDEMIIRESYATLLVNPRPSNELFTKYSFPSKTIEYMATGTPVLSTRLPGIPAEYEPYLLWFNDESTSGFRERLESTMKMPDSQLEAIGNAAMQFVLKNKNTSVQGAKCLKLIRTVMQQ